MISFRHADILDKVKKTTLGAYLLIDVIKIATLIPGREPRWRSEIYFSENNNKDLGNAIEKVIMGFDDFKKVPLEGDRKPYGDYGYKGQVMSTREDVEFNINEIIRGIKFIQMVKEVDVEYGGDTYRVKVMI